MQNQKPRKINILYQDRFFCVVDKPTGWTVYFESKKSPSLQLKLARQLNQKLYPVHRLDKSTEGIVLFAFTAQIASLLSHYFSKNKIQKKYLAVVTGPLPDTGTIQEPIAKKGEPLKKAKTTFKRMVKKTLDTGETIAIAEITPHTGRFHQIRKHLNYIQCPIIGDPIYGNRAFDKKYETSKCWLLASEVKLIHPRTRKPMIIRSSLVQSYQNFIKDFLKRLLRNHPKQD